MKPEIISMSGLSGKTTWSRVFASRVPFFSYKTVMNLPQIVIKCFPLLSTRLLLPIKVSKHSPVSVMIQYSKQFWELIHVWYSCYVQSFEIFLRLTIFKYFIDYPLCNQINNYIYCRWLFDCSFLIPNFLEDIMMYFP